MDLVRSLAQSYADSAALVSQFASTPSEIEKTVKVSQKIADAFNSGNKILICGNGGSTCDAMHFAEEFTGRYRKNRRALPVISLSDPSHITCVGNDFGFDQIFARGVDAFGKPGDILIGISTSGNSQNIINAVNLAKERQLGTIGLLGKDGGQLKGQCDVEFIIQEKTADRIQELHMTILHIIIEGVERILFPELY